MRGDMTSEEYIIRLLQTIESLDATMRSMREEISYLRGREESSELERRRLLALMEAKDRDNRSLAERIAQLMGKVDTLTKALEDKSHQLANRNRGQFGTTFSHALPCEGDT